MKLPSPRQKKIAGLIQKELAILINKRINLQGTIGMLVSITKVDITVDISLAKVYISVFPSKNAVSFLSYLKENQANVKHGLSQKIKNQLRKTPDLNFFIDDSLDYIENINSALKNPINPIDINNGNNK
tara:strand:+ start:2909 stop:3295 length:387 start_codon:yes stop_codon:yes gene_type:complete